MTKKILICDDDEMVVKTIQFRVIEDKLGEVFIARNGLQALKFLREQHFDLVITDIHMPYHNGDEVVSLIRVEQKKNIPIIMISSDGDEEVVTLAKKLGVNEFISKPVKSKEVGRLVRQLFA